MIAATVVIADAAAIPPRPVNTGFSLYDLINLATPGQFPVPAFGGRVCEVQIQVLVATATGFHLVYKPGTVVPATDSGFQFLTTTDDASGSHTRLVIRAPTGNQLSLKDIYLAATVDLDSARILAFTL